MNKLEKIAQILGITLSTSEVVEQTFAAESKLMDGTRIFTESDAFVVGTVVQVETEEGMVLAPAGEHVLEDGNIIEVDETGTIIEVKAPEAEEAPEAPIEEELAEEEEVVEEEETFSFGKKDYEEMMGRIQKLEEVLLGAVEALNKTNKELVEKVETLSAQPAAAPVKTRKPLVEENALAGLKLPKRN
jgi:hypothetical protein